MSERPRGPQPVRKAGASASGSSSTFAGLASAPPDLDVLLLALRAEKIPVGIGELTWLRHAFSLNPTLDRERLRALLACTLVKDPVRRAEFDALFDDWCPAELEAEGSAMEGEGRRAPGRSTAGKKEAARRRRGGQPDQEIEKKERAPEPWLTRLAAFVRGLPQRVASGASAVLAKVEGLARRRVFWLSVILVIALAVAGVYHYHLLTPAEPVIDGTPHNGEPPPTPAEGLRTVRAARAPGAKPFEPVDTAARWAGAGLGLLALILIALAGWRYRRERALPVPVPAAGGPAWLPRLALEGGGPELLDAEQLRILVWGIGRFVSEDLTEQVDAERTVAATARAGGIPELRYRHAVYPREVWLWQDESVEDPAVERLADEVEGSLERAGLPVRRGWFADLPNLVRWREGQELAPEVVEGHRQSALVAVLTDGAGLALAEESALRRGPLVSLLRGLAEWPRIAFVDFARGRHGLSERLRPYRLACIDPGALPAFLGEGWVGSAPVRGAEAGLLGDLRAWAAATALSAEPLDAATAYALRRALKLGVSPLGFEQLLRNGEDRAGLLAWPADRRIELLDWLARSQASGETEQVPAASLLGRALAFWRARYQEEREKREKAESRLHPWKGTAAEQRLRLEEALLDLWTRPAQAASDLYGLFGGALGDEVRRRLALYAPRERGPRGDRIRLPWRWSRQPEKVRWLYAKMGLGGEGALAPRGKLRPTATLAAALGLCLGLLVLAVAVAVRPPMLEEWTDPESSIVLVPIPGGTFRMGSPETDSDAYKDERPQHEVSVGPFWMARTETTNAQYRRLHTDHEGADDLPAANVTWDEAKAFCGRYGFHLPTEAQWEYAARAGTTTRWSFGDEEADLGRYAWYRENSDSKTRPVGTKAPNPWGLYDMHGNVWEWVEDCYDENAYGNRPSAVEDPLVVGDPCRYRVVRGGSAWHDPGGLRSASRVWSGPEGRVDDQGFRCLRVPGRQLEPLSP